MFLPHPCVKVSIVGSLRDREVACSASDRQGSNFESCVWRTVSSQSSHHPQEVLLAQFSLYVHKGGLKPDSFHFIFWISGNGRENVVKVVTKCCIRSVNALEPTRLRAYTYYIVRFTLTVLNFRWFLSQFSTNCHPILKHFFSSDADATLKISEPSQNVQSSCRITRHSVSIMSLKLVQICEIH